MHHIRIAFGTMLAALLAATGCNPIVEPGPELPAPPTAEVTLSFLDSNTVVFEAETGADVFMQLWDFGNGKTSSDAVDTMTYYVEGSYAISHQAHGTGGMALYEDTVVIERTLELPCEGTLALLSGCDNPKTWKFSSEQGAVSVGPVPLDGEYYASPANGLAPFQIDDRWQLLEDGTFIYSNGGGTQNPFEGYVETLMTVEPSTYTLELDGSEIDNNPQFFIGPLVTEVAELCGWMGTWDSGFGGYTIMSLSEDKMVLVSKQQAGDCTLADPWAYFTFTFVTE